ncbi:MAG: hypothetical protein ACTSRR_11540 [Candidatus Heimdallarchaeaceae archaeon]
MKLLPKDKNAWSHHPNCSFFANHVYVIKGYRICRGCTNFYSGLAIGVIFYLSFSFYKVLDVPALLLIIISTFIPTIFTVFFEIKRIIKDIARFLLGFSTASSIYIIFSSVFYSFVDKILWYRIVIPISVTFFFFIIKRIFTSKRFDYNAKVCLNCPLNVCELLSKGNVIKQSREEKMENYAR